MTNVINIMIAEDEPHIALALGAIIKKGIAGSVVTVTHDGAEALEKLLSADYHLIISDWNMPKMTGVELLSHIRGHEKLKNTPFIMLTARGDKDSVLEALKSGVTQYIAKPFDNKAVIDKAIALLKSNATVCPLFKKAGNAENQAIKEPPKEENIITVLAKKLKSGDIDFPVIPEVGMRAAELAKSDDVSLEKLSALILQDPALTAKLISIANLTFYSKGRGGDSIEDAIARIGLRDVSLLIVSITNKSMYMKASGIFAERLAALWTHSFATATCARIIGNNLKTDKPDRLFFMGLLHDIGKVMLLTVLSELAKKRTVTAQNLDETLNQLHVRFGKAVVDQWNMSDDFVHVVERHHDIAEMAKYAQETQIIAFANILVRKLGYSLIADDGADLAGLADSELAKLLSLDENKIAAILEATDKYVSSMKAGV